MIMGFALMIILVIVLGVVSYIQSRELQNQTKLIYEQSLQVRRAVDNIKIDILKMRVVTRDLMLAKDINEQQEAIESTEIATEQIEQEFNIIKSLYVGPQDDVVKAYDAFLDWKTKRLKNHELVFRGEIDQIKENLKDSGSTGKLRTEMLNRIDVIDRFAFAESEKFYQNSIKLNRDLNIRLFALVFSIVLLKLLVNFLLLRNIRKPIEALTEVAVQLQNGKYDVRSGVLPNNEFGLLANSFNALAENLEMAEKLNKMESDLSGIMLREDDSHQFFSKLLPVLMNQTNSQISAVYLLNDTKDKYEHFFSLGTDEQARRSFLKESYEGELGSALLTQKIQHIKNIPLETRFVFNTTTGRIIPREILTIPIVKGAEVVAVITLASVRSFPVIVSQLIDKIYDTLNARVVGVLAIMQQKAFSNQLAEASAYNRCLIESSIDSFVMIGLDGIITDVNHATEKMTGYKREKLIGTDFSNYFTQPDRARAVYEQVYKEGFVQNLELKILHADGRIIPVLYNGNLYRDKSNKEIGVFATARDVTEPKRIEEELIWLNGDLKQRSEALKTMNDELEIQKNELSAQSEELSRQNALMEQQKNQLNEANNLKTSFLSNMSHELRTPLNSIIALSGVLNRRLLNVIPETEYGYIDVIERNGKHLLSLINEILDISRIESGKIEIESVGFNMNDLIAEVVTMIKPQAEQKRIGFVHKNAEEVFSVHTDVHKCSHILQNLLSNAVKFTENGQVEVEAMKVDDMIEITVSDTGVGIPASQIPHIFDEFRQADSSTSRKFGGTGLGLAIARKYVNLLGGSIGVSSVLNVGSVFKFNIPVEFKYENMMVDVPREVRSVKATGFASENKTENKTIKDVFHEK